MLNIVLVDITRRNGANMPFLQKVIANVATLRGDATYFARNDQAAYLTEQELVVFDGVPDVREIYQAMLQRLRVLAEPGAHVHLISYSSALEGYFQVIAESWGMELEFQKPWDVEGPSTSNKLDMPPGMLENACTVALESLVMFRHISPDTAVQDTMLRSDMVQVDPKYKKRTKGPDRYGLISKVISTLLSRGHISVRESMGVKNIWATAAGIRESGTSPIVDPGKPFRSIESELERAPWDIVDGPTISFRTPQRIDEMSGQGVGSDREEIEPNKPSMSRGQEFVEHLKKAQVNCPPLYRDAALKEILNVHADLKSGGTSPTLSRLLDSVRDRTDSFSFSEKVTRGAISAIGRMLIRSESILGSQQSLSPRAILGATVEKFEEDLDIRCEASQLEAIISAHGSFRDSDEPAIWFAIYGRETDDRTGSDLSERVNRLINFLEARGKIRYQGESYVPCIR